MKGGVPLDSSSSSSGITGGFAFPSSGAGSEQIVTVANSVESSGHHHDGFPGSRRGGTAVLDAILDAVRGVPSRAPAGSEDCLADFDWRPEAVDRSDSRRQCAVIRHHYRSELGRGGDERATVEELAGDYSDDAVIHEVIDDVPHTYRGALGVRQSVRDFVAMLHADDDGDGGGEGGGRPKVEILHVKIHRNHAQVTWKAETPKHTHIFGTDAFTFDENNRIKSQSIVALSQGHAPAAEQK